jgi:NADH dehydrogenase
VQALLSHGVTDFLALILLRVELQLDAMVREPAMNATANRQPRVVIVGAGFGGLPVARRLARTPLDVLLIDRNNYHGFWPLLYQVATAGLEPQQIAYPIRGVIRRSPAVRFQIATVSQIDFEHQAVITDAGNFDYDELVIAAGSTNNFFGIENVQKHAFGFKELPEALALRNHIIMCFERALTETDPEQLQRLLNFVVVGGGPTGVELAGAIAELITHVMRKDYPSLDFTRVHVVLIEMLKMLLPSFPATLGQRAQHKLVKLGVDVRLGASVADYVDDVLELKDGATLPTRTVVWAAGIQGAPLASELGVPLERGKRIRVTPELRLPQYSNVWLIGDLAYLEDQDGKPYPQLATVAMQQGRLVADNIRRKLHGQPAQPFHYLNKGSMATVGRNFAIARIWKLNWSGYPAWLLWLFVHLLYLLGTRNRILVLVNWIYNYFTYDRAARAIVAASSHPVAEEASARSAAPQAAR